MQKLVVLFMIILIISPLLCCNRQRNIENNAKPDEQSEVAAFSPSGYVLSWQDTFRTFNSVNWSKGLESDISDDHIIWNPTTGGKGLLNDTYCGYITDEDVYIEGGQLVLCNHRRNYQGQFPAGQYECTSGWVNSIKKRIFNGTEKGVYIEIKAQFPSGLKVWPAIWMILFFGAQVWAPWEIRARRFCNIAQT